MLFYIKFCFHSLTPFGLHKSKNMILTSKFQTKFDMKILKPFKASKQAFTETIDMQNKPETKNSKEIFKKKNNEEILNSKKPSS